MIKFSRQFKVYAGHYQFYIEDLDAKGNKASQTFWSDSAFRRRIALASGIIGVGTSTYDYVPVNLQVFKEKPADTFIDNAAWDHIAEASIRIKSGNLLVLSCPDGVVEANISITPNTYRVRVYSKNLHVIDSHTDEYLIVVWAEPHSPPKILKQGITDK